MRYLVAVPFEEYQSSNSFNGVRYNVVSTDGILFLRCVVTDRKYADHDLVIKEVSEAPSNVRVAIKKHLNEVLGEGEWEMRTRLPFNAAMSFDQIIGSKLDSRAVEFQYNPDEARVEKHRIDG